MRTRDAVMSPDGLEARRVCGKATPGSLARVAKLAGTHGLD